MPINQARYHKPAIAYIRVSTKKQGATGIGLEAQTVAIDTFAEHEGYFIVERFKDVASGWGKNNLERRDGMKSALEMAKKNGMPIIVASASRISRSADTIFRIAGQEGVEIISATQGSMASPATLASSAARAEFERQNNSEKTKRRLQELKSQGVKLGNPKNLPEAQKKGAAANKDRARRVVSQIADVLDEFNDDETVKAKDLVPVLNERRILTGWNRPWTKSALRRPLAEAKKLRQERLNARRVHNPLYGRF
jgi:DNA invertase Pin-like site-specific DNA recombinase